VREVDLARIPILAILIQFHITGEQAIGEGADFMHYSMSLLE